MSRADVAGLPGVSRETLDRLDTLVALLARWNPRINLVAPSTLPEVWNRHILDSAQLWALAGPGVRHWADLGSGGGFPGLVIAALAAGTPTRVTLVESDGRKAAFLRTAARDMGVDVTVFDSRIEDVPPLGADVVSARALAPLVRLLGLVVPHLAPGGRAILPKGARHAAEVSEALDSWRFTLETHASVTDPDSVILVLKDIARV